MAQEAIRYAREHRKPICICWIDLANAFGSVPHNLVQFSMEWFAVPRRFRNLIFNYYKSIYAFVEGPNWNSDWFWISTGVPQGCTASTIIFDMVFQLLLDIHKSFVPNISFKMPRADISIFNPTYADDVALLSDTPEQNQLAMEAFQKAWMWSQSFKLKIPKCRSFAAKLFNDSESLYTKSETYRYSSFDPLLSCDEKK